MYIRVNVKQLGSRRKPPKPQRFYLENVPTTVEMLITEAVRTCVQDYNARLRMTEAQPLSDEAIEQMQEVGKIAFGINYGGKEANLSKAQETAHQAFADGLYKIFIDDVCVEDAMQEIALTEETQVTFIRLTMLSGCMW